MTENQVDFDNHWGSTRKRVATRTIKPQGGSGHDGDVSWEYPKSTEHVCTGESVRGEKQYHHDMTMPIEPTPCACGNDARVVKCGETWNAECGRGEPEWPQCWIGPGHRKRSEAVKLWNVVMAKVKS